MVPGQEMRWVHWWFSIAALRDWVLTYDSVDLDFDVQVVDLGIVGTGRLTSII